MTKLEREIVQMYADIAGYGGDFGDGVEHGTYDPYALIRAPALTPFEKTGVSVALLHYLATAIDNSTHAAAVKAHGPAIESILADGVLHDQPFVGAAASAFLVSETAFLREVKNVYENVVRELARA